MSVFRLLATRRFLPIFATQFLGAFNGTFCKNAAIVLILYRFGAQGAGGGKVLATAAAGLFVLPFLLFSAPAGQLADRLDKARMIRLTKLLEIAAALVSAIALATAQPWMLLTALFLLGCQASLFGPLKYGILPDHLASGELLAANGLVEAATFIAILAGTLLGSLAGASDAGMRAVEAGLPVIALAGWAASLAIPPAPPRAPGLAVRANIAAETWTLLRETAEVPQLLAAMMGVSWFWLVGATYLTQFPAFARDALHADPGVVSLFLVMFTLGIGAGSLLCQRLLRGVVSLRLAPWGALGMALFGLDFALAAEPATPGPLADAGAFLMVPAHWRLLADLVLTALAAGLYVVPLYAFLQSRALPERRARVIAANNVLNAVYMTLGALAAGALMAAGMTVRDLLIGMAAANFPAAMLTWRRLRPGTGLNIGTASR